MKKASQERGEGNKMLEFPLLWLQTKTQGKIKLFDWDNPGKGNRGFQRQLTPTKASMGVMCQPAICAFENFPRESIVEPSIEL